MSARLPIEATAARRTVNLVAGVDDAGRGPGLCTGTFATAVVVATTTAPMPSVAAMRGGYPEARARDLVATIPDPVERETLTVSEQTVYARP